MEDPSHNYTCPVCGLDVSILDSIGDCDLECDNCGASLICVRDGEQVNGMWKDLTKLYVQTNPQH